MQEQMGRRVLVVEDDLSMANVMTQMLKKDGVDHLLVTSSDSALEMAELEDFGILLTDLGLPERGDEPQKVSPFAGFQLALNICQMIPGIRLIFCTGKGVTEVQEKLPAGLGSVSFLQKPFRLQELRRVISPIKKAAVVAIPDLQAEAAAIREMELAGYTVYTPFEGTPDRMAAESLRQGLIPFFDETTVVCV